MDISETQYYKKTFKKSKTIAFWYPPLILVICILVFGLVLLNFNYLPNAVLRQDEVKMLFCLIPNFLVTKDKSHVVMSVFFILV